MRLNVNLALVLSGFAVVSMALAANSALARNILVASDAECTEMGGRVNGHKNVLMEDESNPGKYVKVRMSRCWMEDAPSSPGATVRSLSGFGSTSTFSKIVEVAEMGKTLDGESDITVFAPTNKALSKLTERALRELHSDKAAARDFVMRHVVVGKRVALDFAPSQGALAAGKPMTTGDRTQRRVEVKSDRLSIGRAKIVAADIETSNGIIYLVDSVFERD